MKIRIYCDDCGKNGVDNPFMIVPINQSGIYSLTCSNGHNATFVLNQQKYQVLAEGAMQAIIDDYFREAVSSFTACLERFYEFYIRVIAFHRLGADKIDEIEKTWKLVKNMSERQTGMYFLAYLFDEGRCPDKLKDNMTSIRNKVIHQGLMPSRDEAIDYGQAVMDVLQPVLWDTADRYKAEITALSLIEQRRLHQITQHIPNVRRNNPALHLSPHNYQRIRFDIRQQAESRGKTALRVQALG